MKDFRLKDRNDAKDILAYNSFSVHLENFLKMLVDKGRISIHDIYMKAFNLAWFYAEDYYAEWIDLSVGVPEHTNVLLKLKSSKGREFIIIASFDGVAWQKSSTGKDIDFEKIGVTPTHWRRLGALDELPF